MASNEQLLLPMLDGGSANSYQESQACVGNNNNTQRCDATPPPTLVPTPKATYRIPNPLCTKCFFIPCFIDACETTRLRPLFYARLLRICIGFTMCSKC